MSTEVKTPEIQLIDLTGAEARAMFPNGAAWPDDAAVCLAVEGERLVGHTSALPSQLIEGTVISDDKVGTSLAFRLVKHMEELLKSGGNSVVFAFAPDSDPKVGDYLSRVGYVRLPVTLYLKKLE